MRNPLAPLDAIRSVVIGTIATYANGVSDRELDAARRALEDTAETSPSLTDRLLAQAILEEIPEPVAPDFHAEAETFIEHATRCGAHSAVVNRKALDGLRFSRDHNARSYSIPSKLRGVKEHRERIEQYAERGFGYGCVIELVQEGEGIVARAAGEEIGEVASKYTAWLRPLLPYGVQCHALQVTGLDDPRKTPGVNVAFSHITEAIRASNEASEEEPDEDGATAAELQERLHDLF